MELLFIFAAGWVMSHAFGEKRDEYEHAQDAHRQKYMNRLAEKHPHWSQARKARYLQNAARRNTLGHFAYLLRHGWSSTFNDFTHGWDKAKAAHEEWKAAHPKGEKNPGRWETFKAGWDNNKATREAEKAKAAAVEPTPQEHAKPVPPPRQPEPNSNAAKATQEADGDGEGAEVIRWPGQILIRGMGIDNTKPETPGNTAGRTNGAPVTVTIASGESTNLDDVRHNSATFVETLQQVNGAADQLLADVLRFAGKDVETRGRIERGMEHLLNAIAEFGAIPSSLQKHAGGEEYAQSAHAVDDINALRGN